jgi:hypothetical protein
VLGHGQTDRRGRCLASCLFALVAFATLGSIRAEDPQMGESPYSTDDPVTLAADNLRYWDTGKDRWVVLEGHAAALSGVEGTRSDRAVARIREVAVESKRAYQVEVFAEGNPRDSSTGGISTRPMRRVFVTTAGVTAKSFQPNGMTAGKGDPTAVALVARAFPVPKAAPEKTKAALSPPARPPSDKSVARTNGSAISETGLRVNPGLSVAPPSREGFADGSLLSAPAAGSTSPSASVVPDVLPVIAPPASNEPPAAARPKVDAQVVRAQAPAAGFPDGPGLSAPGDDPFPRAMPPPIGVPPRGDPPVVATPPDDGDPFPLDGEPVPVGPAQDVPSNIVPPTDLPNRPKPPNAPGSALAPDALRFWSISPRLGGEGAFQVEMLPTKDDWVTIVARGGVVIIADVPGKGTVDISADSAVIWTRRDSKGEALQKDENDQFVQPTTDPMEAYLEGNVVLRNDTRKYAGNADAKVFRAPQAYYDFKTERSIALDGELNLFAPGLITPMKITAREINQYRPYVHTPNGPVLGRSVMQADNTVSTGSRFPRPGYRFSSKSMDIYQLNGVALDPTTGAPVGRIRDPKSFPPGEDVYRIDARQNVFFINNAPFFYWPHLVTDSDDLDPTLRMITYRYVNYFGHQIYTDWNGFKLINTPKPKYIDQWNIDVDYLVLRGPALGSEIGWFGSQITGMPKGPFNGYLDLYGIYDNRGFDTLGPGPAVITDGPPGIGKDTKFSRVNDPFFNKFRGRALMRHMQSLLDPDIARDDEDLRFQIELGYVSDRNFMEEYYKRLFDSGMDQGTDAYLLRQTENRALTVMGSVNLQSWYTDTQFLPKLEYYRLGDSWLGGLLSYSTDSGIDYANVHTAVEVNNPNLFAFIPYDPVSNTSGPWQSGRAWTSHEVDMPLNFDFIRFVPYAQGQLTAWDNQLDGNALGRAWGAVGGRANVMAWKAYPGVHNDLLNINGLNHKISFDVDARFAYSNVNLNQIAIQDQLDDNTYEWARRYFALTNYLGGVLPPQYDPRFLTLRRAISPIAGTTDVQASINTIKMGIHQRLQTKRGPANKQRIIDWMVFDVSTTYFPDASRDNFGKPFGQNTYNWEWFLGDRTSIVSTGWFEFFDVTGRPMLIVNPRHTNDPFLFNVVNTGISISRPPRGNIFIGYSVINTGTIATSAMNVSFSYLLSPKWYSTFTTIYDFGNAILLSASGSITRVGADWLTSVGVSFDPQRSASQFSVELTPRLSPNMRFGSSGAASRFDPRFAPTQ